MGIGNFFKTLGKGVLRGVDIGAKADLPIIKQIDSIADTIAEVKGKRKVDADNMLVVLQALEDLKTAVPEVKSAPKAALESNRFKMTLIAIVTSLAVYIGLPEEVANHIAELVLYIVGVYVIGDTVRPSLKFGGK